MEVQDRNLEDDGRGLPVIAFFEVSGLKSGNMVFGTLSVVILLVERLHLNLGHSSVIEHAGYVVAHVALAVVRNGRVVRRQLEGFYLLFCSRFQKRVQGRPRLFRRLSEHCLECRVDSRVEQRACAHLRDIFFFGFELSDIHTAILLQFPRFVEVPENRHERKKNAAPEGAAPYCVRLCLNYILMRRTTGMSNVPFAPPSAGFKV